MQLFVSNLPYMNKWKVSLKNLWLIIIKPYSSDLFSVFIYRNFDYCKPDGYSAFMTPFVWMFIKTYEKLREFVIDTKSITTLVQMEYSAFEEATVPICSFVLQNCRNTEKSLCFRLSDFKGGMEVQKQNVLEALADKNCGYFYEADQSNFSKIPGSPIAYWVSENVYSVYENCYKLGEIAPTKKGLDTGDNNRFLKYWHEVSFKKIGIGYKSATDFANAGFKWAPHDKGGEFRRWYGNKEWLINWSNNGYD